MLTANTGTQAGVLAWATSKEAGPFFCPMCLAPVVLKKGSYRAHHFAHIPPSDCQYGMGETELHRRAKKELYEALLQHPQVTKLQLERPLGEVRPDLSFWLRSTPVAVEVQLSTLSLATLDYRTRMYHQKGISVLWTPPLDEEQLLDGERYAPRLWEKYLHALYFGRVCYWLRGETLHVRIHKNCSLFRNNCTTS